MKKVVCILTVFFLFLCGCSFDDSVTGTTTFIEDENGTLMNGQGAAYTHLANEGFLYYLGDLEFCGRVEGEEKTSQHLGLLYQTGMFALKNTGNDNILIRRMPNNEWFSVYRKASLPEFDYSVDNCIRFEFISDEIYGVNTEHITCKKGICEKSDIAEFLSEIRSQQSPTDAGLYDLIKKPDGTLEKCYICGVIYGFFEEEPNLVVRMDVTSYNDLSYSVRVEGKDYVLPEELLQKIKDLQQ